MFFLSLIIFSFLRLSTCLGLKHTMLHASVNVVYRHTFASASIKMDILGAL